ncbi:MAG: hypothetical protein Q9207_002295 [Kuettlingeria erythrocarpa]
MTAIYTQELVPIGKPTQEGTVNTIGGSPPHSKRDHDNSVLARLGKKAVLERRFGFIAICGFSCTILITWEGVLGLFINGLTNGGSAGLIYGYLFVWVGTIAVFTTMAELASM